MTHGSLFSGIGGFDLAAEWMGWQNKFHCEINDFGQKILKYYWPNATSYSDIKATDFTIWNGKIDILTGGFPCQPFSIAGKRKGAEDDRHLWPEMLRAIKEIQPRWVVGENVHGIINWNGGLVFEQVQIDLENEGYEVQPYILPACAVNAPHRRDRVWFVAYRSQIGLQSSGNTRQRGTGFKDNDSGIIAYAGLQRPAQRQEPAMGIKQFCEKQSLTNTEGNGFYAKSTPENNQWKDNKQSGAERFSPLEGFSNERNATNADSKRYSGEEYWIEKTKQYSENNKGFRWQDFPTQSPIRSGNDGIPDRLDGITFSKWRNESIKAYGNAIVPQIVFEIFKAIEKYDTQRNLGSN